MHEEGVYFYVPAVKEVLNDDTKESRLRLSQHYIIFSMDSWKLFLMKFALHP